MKYKLPDFIGCGFQKCATTALTFNLSKHPNISVPLCEHDYCFPDNEFNFFCRYHACSKLDIEWYKSNFVDDGNIHGDISPNYSPDSDKSAKSIYKVHPDVKILFTMRNPIDRAYSAYNHYMKMQDLSKNWGNWDPTQSFMWNITENDCFRCDFIDAIKNYEKYFSKDKMYILIQEKLIKNPQEEYNKLFDFLGVDHHLIENKIYHSRKKNKVLTQDERQICKKIFESEVNDLFDHLGREITEWSDFVEYKGE